MVANSNEVRDILVSLDPTEQQATLFAKVPPPQANCQGLRSPASGNVIQASYPYVALEGSVLLLVSPPLPPLLPLPDHHSRHHHHHRRRPAAQVEHLSRRHPFIKGPFKSHQPPRTPPSTPPTVRASQARMGRLADSQFRSRIRVTWCKEEKGANRGRPRDTKFPLLQ